MSYFGCGGRVIGHETEPARTVQSHFTDGTAVEDEMENRGVLFCVDHSVLCPAETTILDDGADKEQVLRTYRKLGCATGPSSPDACREYDRVATEDAVANSRRR